MCAIWSMPPPPAIACAAEALQVFVYQVKKTIGAYAAAMGGLDAVAFTGGIGENSASAARRLLRGSGVSGHRARPGIERPWQRRSRGVEWAVAVLALATNEELIVARRAFQLLARVCGTLAS